MRDYDGSWYTSSGQVCYDCYNLGQIESQRKAQEEAKQCYRCKKSLPAWRGKDYRGKTYCEGCYGAVVDEYTKQFSCQKCGKFIEREEDRKAGPKGMLVCPKCYDASRGRFGMGSVKGLFCPQCGGRLSEGHAHQAGNMQVCDSCNSRVAMFETCNICGKHLGILKVILPNGSTICPECAKKQQDAAKKKK